MPPQLELSRLKGSHPLPAKTPSPQTSSRNSSATSYSSSSDQESSASSVSLDSKMESFREKSSAPSAAASQKMLAKTVGNFMLLQYEVGRKGSVFGLYGKPNESSGKGYGRPSGTSRNNKLPTAPPRTWSRLRRRVSNITYTGEICFLEDLVLLLYSAWFTFIRY